METMNGLLEFIHVAESRSFTNAAKTLKVSKSHISKQISKLEDSLQVSLLIRTTRKITLTEAGMVLFERSRHLFSDLSDIFAEVTQKQKEPSGLLKVSVAGAFAEEHLAKCFSDFLKMHSKIKIEMIFSENIVDMIEENFDLAVRYGNLTSSSLISKKIASRREFICASPEYIQKQGIPFHPEELKNHNCLLNSTESWNLNSNNKHVKLKMKGNWKSNNPRALKTAALNGLGIIKLPSVYVLSEIKSGKLISLLEEYTKKEQDIWILYPQKNHLPQRVRLLIDYLHKFLQQHYKGESF